jgi:hypothetical protein
MARPIPLEAPVTIAMGDTLEEESSDIGIFYGYSKVHQERAKEKLS